MRRGKDRQLNVNWRRRIGGSHLRSAGLTAVLAVGVAFWLPPAGFVPIVITGAAQSGQPGSEEARAALRRAVSAVGLVFVGDANDAAPNFPRLRGSAVVVRKDGIIVTNYHVICHDGGERLYDEILFSFQGNEASASGMAHRYRVKPAVIRKEYDLVLLRLVSDSSGRPLSEAVFPAVELGQSRQLQLLDELIVIGYPEKGGVTVTVNKGVVEGLDDQQNWIRTDARLMHGNSGGAAVNSDGKLIGIPTKVVLDTEAVDPKKGGEGRPLGGVGFLRPAHLIASMLSQLSEGLATNAPPKTTDRSERVAKPVVEPARPHDATGQAALLILRGVVKSASDGKPIGGARVGLIPVGSASVTAANLLTWGGSNADGRFEMNKQVPAGKYTLKAVAFGYVSSTRDVEVSKPGSELIVELRPNP